MLKIEVFKNRKYKQNNHELHALFSQKNYASFRQMSIFETLYINYKKNKQ